MRYIDIIDVLFSMTVDLVFHIFERKSMFKKTVRREDKKEGRTAIGTIGKLCGILKTRCRSYYGCKEKVGKRTQAQLRYYEIKDYCICRGQSFKATEKGIRSM